ncbi:MAG TPA: hypothetical protein VFT82_00960 [Candidatus Paceibacterota bacterium]|nr:hypothetical protein [Candidatus Paceibacterota bacterium]
MKTALLSFEIGGIRFECLPHHENSVREAMRDFPAFITLENDEIVVDWEPYAAASEEDRGRLLTVLFALDALTDEPRNRIGIFPKGDTRYYWGPTDHGTWIYFKRSWEDVARGFIETVVPALAREEGVETPDVELIMISKDGAHAPLPIAA